MVESVRNLDIVWFNGVMCVVQTLALVCPYSELDGNMTSISGNSLPPGITEIWLLRIPITSIADDAFDTSAATLQKIIINRANLSSLPTVLRKLTKLTYLAITDTVLQNWDAATLKQIAATLENLQLSNIGLSSWPSWISDFHLLHSIDLSWNSLKSIPDDAFSFVKDSLKSLYLEGTGLTHLPDALSILSSLETVSLSYNNFKNLSEIEKITVSPFAQKLSSLYLDSVGLTTANFSNLTSLRSISLTGNKISDVPAGSLPASILSAFLSDNRLSSVPPDVASMTGLYYLDLLNNLITVIEPNTFPPSLTNVELSYNNITIITNSTLKNLKLLNTVGFSYNPISTISPYAFSDLVSLQSLYLNNLHLTEIPLAFAQLRPETEIYFSTSQLLSCPCPASQELVQWFASLTYNWLKYVFCRNGQSVTSYLSGQCGQPTVTP